MSERQMGDLRGTPAEWAAFKNVLVYADMALHAHSQGRDMPPLPPRDVAKAWLDDSFVLRTRAELAANEKIKEQA